MLCNYLTTFCPKPFMARNKFIMISIAPGKKIADAFNSVSRKDTLHEVSE